MSDLKVFTDDSLHLFCSSGHTWRVVGYDVASGIITEKCTRCSFQHERQTAFATVKSRERAARNQDKVGKDAARRFEGKVKGQSKRVGQHPATRKR